MELLNLKSVDDFRVSYLRRVPLSASQKGFIVNENSQTSFEQPISYFVWLSRCWMTGDDRWPA
eukprot:458497-Amphidinium_carterae.1